MAIHNCLRGLKLAEVTLDLAGGWRKVFIWERNGVELKVIFWNGQFGIGFLSSLKREFGMI